MERYDRFAGFYEPGRYHNRPGLSPYDEFSLPGSRERNRDWISAWGRRPDPEASTSSRRSRGADEPYRGRADEETARCVRQTLVEDRWLDASSIHVDVRNGVVLLRGEVADYLQARYAWDDAWESDGVRGVVSRLEVSGDGSAPE